jgi:hypothetical protein
MFSDYGDSAKKSAWVHYAMLKLLQEEQDFCFEHHRIGPIAQQEKMNFRRR